MVRLEDGTFDGFASRVRRALGVPMALVTLIEDDCQVFMGATGLPEPFREVRETPLSHSFCKHVVQDEGPLVVTDARLDVRFRTNPAVQDLGVVAYAGSPLIRYSDRRVIGALCAIDHEPREWTTNEMLRLAELARECSVSLGDDAAGPRDR